MFAYKSNVPLLLSFGFFLTIVYTCVLSVSVSGWSYNPTIEKVNNVSVVKISPAKVLGMSVVAKKSVKESQGEGKIIQITKHVLENELYIKEQSIDKSNENLVIQTTTKSSLKLQGINRIHSISIRSEANLEAYKFQLSFDNGKTWVYLSKNQWINAKDNNSVEANNGMDVNTLKIISVKDYFKKGIFSPGISEQLLVKFIVSKTDYFPAKITVSLSGT